MMSLLQAISLYVVYMVSHRTATVVTVMMVIANFSEAFVSVMTDAMMCV